MGALTLYGSAGSAASNAMASMSTAFTGFADVAIRQFEAGSFGVPSGVAGRGWDPEYLSRTVTFGVDGGTLVRLCELFPLSIQSRRSPEPDVSDFIASAAAHINRTEGDAS